MAVSATTPPKLQDLFDELKKVAYNPDYNTYRYKEANQAIIKYFKMVIKN